MAGLLLVAVAALAVPLGLVPAAAGAAGSSGTGSPAGTRAHLLAAGQGAGPTVVSVAGTGKPGDGGQGGPATAAALDQPEGIATDSAGDLFVADTDNCRVAEIPAAAGTHYGIAMRAHHLYTVAGTGCAGHPGRSGSVGYPSGVAVDAAGDLFVADATGDRVYELAPSDRPLGASARARLVATVAGTGQPGDGGQGGPATAAALDQPEGIATDSAGDLFVADTDNCRVVEIPAAAGTHYGIAMQAHHLYTVAGNGTCGTVGLGGPALGAELYSPAAVAVDAAGDLLVADRGIGKVVELAASSGTYYGTAIGAGDLAVVAGAGVYASYAVDGLTARGTTAELNYPYGLAVDAAGDLFVTDTGESAVREVAAAAGTSFGRTVTVGDIYTVIGAIPSGSDDDGTQWITAPITAPYGVAVDAAGDLYFSDQQANVIREVRP